MISELLCRAFLPSAFGLSGRRDKAELALNQLDVQCGCQEKECN